MRTRTAIAATVALGLVLASSAFGMAAANADPASPTFSDPVDGAYLSATPDVVSGNANGDTGVTVTVDGDYFCSTTSVEGNWSCGRGEGFGNLALGDHTFTVAADDASFSSITIHIYDANPALSVNSPEDGDTVATETPTFSGTGPKFGSIELYQDLGEDNYALVGTCPVDADGLWSCASDPLGDGPVNIEADAVLQNGDYGNSSYLSLTVIVPATLDHAFSPAGVTLTAGGGTDLIYFYSGADEDVFVHDWRNDSAEIDYCSDGDVGISCASLPTGWWSYNAHNSWAQGGDINEYFYVPDAPIITDVSATLDYRVIVSGTSSPFGFVDSGIVLYVDGNATACLAADGSPAQPDSEGNWSCETTPLALGLHQLNAAVQDLGGGEQGLGRTYVTGGLSALGESKTLTLVAPVTPVTPETPGSSPSPSPSPTSPTWTFDVTGLNLGNVHPGDHFTIHGTGLSGGSTVTFELHSTPVTLGSVSVAPDGSFTLTGVIPANTEPGEHHIVATLAGPGLAPTTADKAITVTADSTTLPATSTDSTSGTASDGGTEHSADALHDPGTAPNILTDSLNPIAEVFTDPGRVPAAFAAGLVLLLFAIMPAHLLNATLGEQYERFARRVPRLRTQPSWFTGLKATLDKAPLLGGVIITAITGFLFAFADPTFGFNLHSLRLVLALGAALFVVTYLANAITALIMRRAWDVDVVVSIRPLGLVLTVVGVIVSRIMDFSPGFLIGLVLGLSIASHSAAKQAWKAVLIRTAVIAAFGIAAWIIYSSIAPGVHHDPTFTNELVLELFVAIATEGVVMMLIELLPFHLLEGERLYKRSRLLWGASYLLLLVVFLLAVVPWEGNWRELGESFWPWFSAVAIFGVVCVSIYLYFRFLAPRDEEGGDHDVLLEDAQERIAVGDD